VFKRNIPRNKHEDGKGSGGKAPLPIRRAERIIEESKEGSGMRRILAFMRGAEIEPDEIFKGDYLGGARPSKGPEGKPK